MEGNRIRERRRAAGLTQRQLCERAGLHEITLSRLETGRYSPSLDSLAKLASALGCQVSDLLPKESAA